MAKLDYLVWEPDWRDGVCRLSALEGVEDQADLAYSLPRAHDFPSAARFAMDPDFPHDTLLADRLVNLSGLVVASERIANYLRSKELPFVEYLPVSVVDHRGRDVGEPYFIVHPVEPVECLDVDACAPRWNKIRPGKIRGVRQLALDPERVDASRGIFACDAFHKPKLIRRDLARDMTDFGFTGSRFVETEEYRG
ncbi:MAG: DUF1629 domain-containing protein [Planctomycetota bacterium]